ncbi:MAG: hypothetical protein DRJ43_01110 [Thermoprotei archaeon]|nr:MAG: hypothetical protein DRJ43_01110 [Thermoprotei archaeon]
MAGERILIVDDEKLMRDYLKYLLEPRYRVDTASSGEEALRMIEEEVYDLVFVDLRLPGMDGIELIRRINELSPGTQTIAMTSYGLIEIESVSRLMKLGAFDCIQKLLIHPEELEQKVEEAIKKGKSLREKRRPAQA